MRVVKQVSNTGKVLHQFEIKDNEEHFREAVQPSKRSLVASVSMLIENSVSFLYPRGYPQSVRNGYTVFMQLQMAAMTLSAAGGVLTTQALLVAIGIGGSEALPLAATLNWVIKDGLGQLGGVVFAHTVNNNFDSNPKRWRMIAALAMDASAVVELATPLFPGYFLPLASIGTSTETKYY